MRQISRREFLRRFGMVVGAAVLMRKIPLPDEPTPQEPTVSTSEINRRTLFRTDGVFFTNDISANPVVWYPEPSIQTTSEYEYHPADVDFTYEPEPFWYPFHAESNDPLDVGRWFTECCILINDAGIDVPQSRRGIECHMPVKIDDLDLTNRFSADWYDGDRRFGFVIKWHDWGRWPTPQEILAMALPMLHSEPDIGPRDRWLPDPRVIWINA